ncbi:MAG: hypothetical protein ACYC5M_07410 [Anaerolineae bacterium]
MFGNILERGIMGGRTGRIIFWATVSLIGCRALWCAIDALDVTLDSGAQANLGDSLANLSRMGGGASCLGWILAVLLVAVLVARDAQWLSLPLSDSCRDVKTVLYLARFASLLPVLLVLAAAPLVIGAFVTLLVWFTCGGLGIGQIDISNLVGGVLRAAWSLLPYVSLSFLLMVDTQSVLAALGGSMVFGVLFEGFLPSLLTLGDDSLAWTAAFLPGHLAAALVGTSSAREAATRTLSIAPAQTALGIAAWTALCLGLALVILVRRDGRSAGLLVRSAAGN